MIRKYVNRIESYVKPMLYRLVCPNRVMLHGIKVDVNHKYITPQLRKIFYTGAYEKHEIEVLSRHLKREDVVLEVGAGIGFLSAFCAKVVGNDNVFAYEANPWMVKKIEETYELNNVCPEIHNVLLSNKVGVEKFYLEENFWSSSVIERSKTAKEINVTTIDVNKELNKKKPNFIIIDIEGGEKDFVSLIDFSEIDKVLIEIHPHIIGNELASRTLQILLSQGFSINFKESRGIVFFLEKEKV